MTESNKHQVSRRDFVKQGTAGLAAAAAAANLGLITSTAHAQNNDRPLGLGIIGCGGRGTGAIGNCLRAAEILGIQVNLVAVADIAQERADRCKNSIRESRPDNYAVTDETTFVGMDAYKTLCAHPDVDIVIQTTPPGLRYLTLREAVNNGKHSFVEKPVCVDADTYRHVLASGEIADENGLSIVSGTQYRREISYRDAITQLQAGVIGQITASWQYYCSNTQWHLGDGTANGGQAWDPMYYQMRNWPYFPWLSGDLIAEQSIHNIDAINWSMGGPPLKAYASGGRIGRTQPDYGTIYDHFSVHFEYADGVKSGFMGRHYDRGTNRVSNEWIGTEGTLFLSPNPGRTSWIAKTHDGELIARNTGRDGNNQPYVEEHRELLAGIIEGEPVQEIQEVADSSLTCILGRESAYTGRELEFEWMAAESRLKLRPDGIDENGPAPGPANLPFPDVRIPGTYTPV